MVDPGVGAANRPPLPARARVRVCAEPDRRPLRRRSSTPNRGLEAGYGARPSTPISATTPPAPFGCLVPASPRSRTPRPATRASSSSPANSSCPERRSRRRQPLRVGRWQAEPGRASLPAVLPGGKAPPAARSPARAGPRSAELWAARRAVSTRRTRSPQTAPGSSSAMPAPGGSTCANRKPRRTIPVSAGPAYWRAATADGSEVFYTEGEDLYRFDVESETREALTSGAAGVLGTLGISTENGSYAYFVATGVLAGNENGNKEKAEAGKGNLYEWHDGETIFIARLGTEELDMTNMTGGVFTAAESRARLPPERRAHGSPPTARRAFCIASTADRATTTPSRRALSV